MIPTHTSSDEQLKDQVIRQALSGDTAGARQTAGEIADRRHLRDAWQMMLFVESERGNVRTLKETILSCPDPSLLASHFYLELPHLFIKAGDRAGAIEIANAMGNAGILPLIGIAAHLAQDGDVAGVREALSHIEDEDLKTMILCKISTLQPMAERLDTRGLKATQGASDTLAA
jgi:hypothetical protein